MKFTIIISTLVIGGLINPLQANLNQILEIIGQSAYSTKTTLRNSYESADYVIKNNIKGDFIECGVAAGAQVGAMYQAIKSSGTNKRIWLFDSFEGIPLAGPNDADQPGVGAIRHDVKVDLQQLLISSNAVYPSELGKAACSSVEEVKFNLKRWNCSLDNMIFVKGWFQHTLPQTYESIEEISLLRLDGDLYESTKVCLEYLFPKVSIGGIIIIDDYALPGCKKACDEYFKKIDFTPAVIPVENSGGVVYFFKI